MLSRNLFRQFGKKIRGLKSREVLDSRGYPTIETEIICKDGTFRSIVPSGASTGIYEATEIRDEDERRYHGKGVQTAVSNVLDVIGPQIVGKEILNQVEIDKQMVIKMDGTKNDYGYTKSHLGANAILSVSMSLARAGASASFQTLFEYLGDLKGNNHLRNFIMPMPFFNVINGGKHAGNSLAFQEFMIVPLGANTFKKAVQMGVEVYMTLKKLIAKEYGHGSTSVGDEGGFAPLGLNSASETLNLLRRAVELAGHKDQIGFALDVAASEFYNKDENVYDLDFKNKDSKQKVSPEEFLEIYEKLTDEFPEIISIEDPFDQDDLVSWSNITKSMGDRIQIVGDDLLVTNSKRIKMAHELKCCNTLLLKVNQVGTITESIESASLAHQYGWEIMVSHRSGDTEDDFIADLAVGFRTGQIKSGAPCRSERTAKYNQLIRIEDSLGENAIFPGRAFRDLHQF